MLVRDTAPLHVIAARSQQKRERVLFTCPKCNTLVHACTQREWFNREATERTLGVQAQKQHAPSCPGKPPETFRQEAVDRPGGASGA